MTNPSRLAIVGSGEIANFHVAAAKSAGFDVVGVAARKNSQTVNAFAQTHAIEKVWSDPTELVASGEWDALILAASTEAVIPLLKQALDVGKPVLVEKPISTSSSELIHLQLPESVSYDQKSNTWDTKFVRLNSVHGFDLANFLTGGLTIESTIRVGSTEDRRGGVVVMSSSRGDICTISANWNAPANFAMTIDRDGERFELRPLEFGTRYQGMQVVEPTNEIPIRRYLPKEVEQFPPDQRSLDFKPGFVAQCEALAGLVRGEHSDIAATINDAYRALLVAEALLD